MRTIIDRRKLKTALHQFGWFVGLWSAGVVTIGGVAMALRFVLHAR